MIKDSLEEYVLYIISHLYGFSDSVTVWLNLHLTATPHVLWILLVKIYIQDSLRIWNYSNWDALMPSLSDWACFIYLFYANTEMNNLLSINQSAVSRTILFSFIYVRYCCALLAMNALTTHIYMHIKLKVYIRVASVFRMLCLYAYRHRDIHVYMVVVVSS